jgi:hypothetical protein
MDDIRSLRTAGTNAVCSISLSSADVQPVVADLHGPARRQEHLRACLCVRVLGDGGGRASLAQPLERLLPEGALAQQLGAASLGGGVGGVAEDARLTQP